MQIIRQGILGEYWGDEFNSSSFLPKERQKVNAKYIYTYFKGLGWTLNAISALLGNMEAESSINPGRWQSDRVGGDAEGHGYGLVQWTPYTKYTEWIHSLYGDTSDPSTIDHNLERIDYEVYYEIQWIPTSKYSMSFKEFTVSKDSPGNLAKAFLLNYERPADQSETAQNYRASLANAWYEYLGGINPTPSKNKKKKKFNFVLFTKRRRII